MDLSKFDTKAKSEKGAWVEIFAPDESETGIKIKVMGRDSTKFKNRMQKIGEANRQKKKGLPIVELERQNIATYVACTMEWENVADGGKPLECSDENVQKVYTEYPWVFEQVVAFVEDRSNFL